MLRFRINFDAYWKEMVTLHIQDFIAFFMPDLYKHVDWTYPPEFLEQELHTILQVSKNKRVVDKLVKLRLFSGEEKIVYVHLEFQTDSKKDISERMFRYYRRMLDIYGKSITALVIYTGRYLPKCHNQYHYDTFGTSITYKFNSYSVYQQNNNIAELENNPNPFSIIVLANLYVLQTCNNFEKRLSFKEQLYYLAEKRGYSEEKTSSLFIFVKELMKLPAELESIFQKTINTHPVNSPSMFPISRQTKAFINSLVKDNFGEDLKEMKKRITKESKKQGKAEGKAEAFEQVVLALYSQHKWSIEQISSTLNFDVAAVEQILKKHNLI